MNPIIQGLEVALGVIPSLFQNHPVMMITSILVITAVLIYFKRKSAQKKQEHMNEKENTMLHDRGVRTIIETLTGESPSTVGSVYGAELESIASDCYIEDSGKIDALLKKNEEAIRKNAEKREKMEAKVEKLESQISEKKFELENIKIHKLRNTILKGFIIVVSAFLWMFYAGIGYTVFNGIYYSLILTASDLWYIVTDSISAALFPFLFFLFAFILHYLFKIENRQWKIIGISVVAALTFSVDILCAYAFDLAYQKHITRIGLEEPDSLHFYTILSVGLIPFMLLGLAIHFLSQESNKIALVKRIQERVRELKQQIGNLKAEENRIENRNKELENERQYYDSGTVLDVQRFNQKKSLFDAGCNRGANALRSLHIEKHLDALRGIMDQDWPAIIRNSATPKAPKKSMWKTIFSMLVVGLFLVSCSEKKDVNFTVIFDLNCSLESDDQAQMINTYARIIDAFALKCQDPGNNMGNLNVAVLPRFFGQSFNQSLSYSGSAHDAIYLTGVQKQEKLKLFKEVLTNASKLDVRPSAEVLNDFFESPPFGVFEAENSPATNVLFLYSNQSPSEACPLSPSTAPFSLIGVFGSKSQEQSAWQNYFVNQGSGGHLFVIDREADQPKAFKTSIAEALSLRGGESYPFNGPYQAADFNTYSCSCEAPSPHDLDAIVPCNLESIRGLYMVIVGVYKNLDGARLKRGNFTLDGTSPLPLVLCNDQYYISMAWSCERDVMIETAKATRRKITSDTAVWVGIYNPFNGEITGAWPN